MSPSRDAGPNHWPLGVLLPSVIAIVIDALSVGAYVYFVRKERSPTTPL